MFNELIATLPPVQQELYVLLKPLIQPILAPMVNDDVSEIFVYAPNRIVYRISGKDYPSTAHFEKETLRNLIQQLGTFNGRAIGFDPAKGETPILEGSLPCGSRVSGVLQGVNVDHDSLTIRKHTRSMLTPDDLVRFGSITPQALLWLNKAIQDDQSILISGSTDSGKTTFLNVIARFLPEDNRILVCEDTPELQIDKPNVARFRTHPRSGIGFLELLDLTSRQSGDHIIFGEIRAGQQTRNGTAGSPAFPFIMALNSGHLASMTTIHADGGEASLNKFVNYCFFSGANVPEHVFRSGVAEAFGVVVQLRKLRGTKKKVVESISKVNGLTDDGRFDIEDVFRYQGESLVRL